MKRHFCSVLLIVLLLPVGLLGLNKTDSQAKSVRKVNTKSVSLPVSKSGIPTEINYQGWLGTSAADTVAVSGKLNMVFKIYTASTDGTLLWTEQDSVQVSRGIFNVLLGSVTPIPDSLFNNSSLYLETQVGLEVLSPRKKIVSVGYAIKSKNSDNSINADTANYARNANVDYVDSSALAINSREWNNNLWGVKYPQAKVADTANYVAGANVNGKVTQAGKSDTSSYILGSNVSGKVATANKADTATYADTAKFALPIRIDFRPTGTTSFTDVFNLGGLLLQARCVYDMSYELAVNVRTTVNNSTVHFTYTFGSSLWGTTTQEGVQDEDFDTADTLSLLNVGVAGYYDVQGMLVYSSPTGANVTIIFQAHDDRGGTTPLGGTVKCLFTGTAFYSPAP
ncbi:MAG: hypothetical protein PHX21_11090 [bacterium]|nr:hypothetical protein [bacterium]